MSAEKERLWAGKHTAAEVGNGRNPLRRRLLSHLRYSGFFGQMLNYGLGSILQKLLGILLLPLYIHALHPAELGALALIEVCQTFFTALGSLGIPYALLRFATDGSSSIGTLLRTSVVCSAVPGLVLSGALMLGFQGLLGLMRLVLTSPMVQPPKRRSAISS